MEEVLLIGCCSLVSMVMLAAMCLHNICVKKKTSEELQRERFERFSRKHMVPRDRYLASRVDFVRRPEENLDSTLASVGGRSEHTYEDIPTPTSTKHDLSVPPRTPSPSVDKCAIVDELTTEESENSASFTKDSNTEDTKNMKGTWLQTPGRLASYISFRQTSHSVLVVPSSVNLTLTDSVEHSDSDNNSVDCGSEMLDVLAFKPLNIDNPTTEPKKIDSCIKKITQDKTDFNLSSNYEKATNKKMSKSQSSWKSDPTYESIRSLTIPKIKVHKAKKLGSGSSEHTYESLNSELFCELGRSDVFERVPDGESDTSSFKRSFESVKSGRDFTVFEINCDDDGNDVFPEYLSSTHFNQSAASDRSSRHSYPGLTQSGNKSETEERYSPFPVAQKLSKGTKAQKLAASPKFSMIRSVSGNLRPKTFNLRPKSGTDQEEYPVLNTPQSIPKIKISTSDCVFLNSSVLSDKDKTLPDILESTLSSNNGFDSEDDKIPPLKTYQTLRSIYSHARRTSRAKRSLMSLPSLTEQTELEIDQHFANNLNARSTPLPVEEMTSVFSSWEVDL